jgi:hypothetical protein
MTEDAGICCYRRLGASHRKSRMEAISAPDVVAPDAGIAEVVAVIYGADWCKACRETAQYLATKGVKYVEKDVDKSSVIQAELQAKFARPCACDLLDSRD